MEKQNIDKCCMSKGAYVYLSYYITLFVKNSFIKLWLTEQKNKSTPNGVAHLNTETFDAFNFKDRSFIMTLFMFLGFI